MIFSVSHYVSFYNFPVVPKPALEKPSTVYFPLNSLLIYTEFCPLDFLPTFPQLFPWESMNVSNKHQVRCLLMPECVKVATAAAAVT